MIRKKFGTKLPTFSEKVVHLALSIPRGEVTTYGDIARAAGGGAMASQSVTNILGKAYDRGVKNIPFHRIVYANGKVWMNDAHREERMKQYKKEKIEVDERGHIVDFASKRHDFSNETHETV